MKFKQFLLETDVEDNVLEKIIKHVNPTYLDAFLDASSDLNDLKKNFIFRGSHSKAIIRNHPEGRKSANTSNEFTFLVDNFLPSWRDYPARSESFICSTSPNTAAAYGDIYYVLPFGNPYIGVCSENDIWYSFPNIEELDKGGSNVPNINYALLEINHLIELNNENDNDDDFEIGIDTVEELKEIIARAELLVKDKTRMKKMMARLNDRSQNNSQSDIALEILHRSRLHGGFIQGLDSLLDPKENNFKLMLPVKLLESKYFDKEVWFSSQAAFLPAEKVKELERIKERIKNLKGKK